MKKNLLLLFAILLAAVPAGWAQDSQDADTDSVFIVTPRDEISPNIYFGACRWYILKTGELVINGHVSDKVDLPNYYKGTPSWLAYKDVITKVTVRHKTINNGLLQGLDKVTVLNAPMTEEIERHALMGFGTPEVILNIPKLKKIDSGGLFGCNARVLDFPTVEELGPDAITHCPNLEVVNLGSNIKYMAAGALAYNPKMVRADGDNRPSLFISAATAPDYSRNYPESIGDKIMAVVAPIWIDAFKELFKKGESAGLKWADGKTGGLASKAYGEYDLQGVVFNYIDELKPAEKGYCCLFGDLTEGNINVAVPADRLETYKVAYSNGIAIDMKERPEAGYMAYNHKAEDNGTKGDKRQVGKFVSGKFYSPTEYECEGVYYVDCRNDQFGGTSLESMKRIQASNELRLIRCTGISTLTFSAQYVKTIKTVTLPSYFDDKFTDNPYMSSGSETIEDYAFLNSPVKEVRGHLGSVGECAFEGCTKLSRIQLDKASEIGKYAFKGCTNLSSIGGTDSWSTLGESAFDGCTSLTASVDLSVADIPDYAFRGCPLSGIQLGNGVKTVGREAFAGSKPTSVSAQQLTSIGEYGFATFTSEQNRAGETDAVGCLKTIELPAIQKIGEHAFENQMVRDDEDDESDFTITLGKKLNNIGYHAFAGCKGLEDSSDEYESGITMKGNVPAGSSDLFSGIQRRFVKLSVPGEYVDAYKSSDIYKEFKISNDLKHFPLTFNLDNGFADLYGDGRLEVHGDGDYSNQFAQPWRYCASLIKKIEFSSDVRRIGVNSFCSLPELTEVIMSNSVAAIEEKAFADCPKLVRVHLSDKISTISKQTFSGCTMLSDLNFPTALENIDAGAFYNCTDLPAYVFFPDNLKTIAESAFYGCTGITHLSFKEKLESIGENAFKNTSVTNIVSVAPNPPACYNAFGWDLENYAKITLDVPERLHLPYFFAEDDWAKMQSSFTDTEHGRMIGHSIYRENMDKEIEGYSVVYEDGYATYTSLVGEGKWAYAFNDGNERTQMPTSITDQVKVLHVPEGITVYNCPRYNFPNLEKLELPLSVTSISHTLQGLTKLKTVDLGNVTEIPEYMFDGCTALEDIDLHKVKCIGRFAFRGCTKLKSVDLSGANSSGEPLDLDTRKVAVLGEEAFANSGLESVAIACELYNKNVFANCKGLHKVELSNWMNGMTLDNESLNTGVFNGCIALDTIIAHMPNALELNQENFSGVTRSNVKLLVRPGAETSYRTAKGWEGFDVEVDETLTKILPTGGISPTIYSYDDPVHKTIWNLDEDGVLSFVGTTLADTDFNLAYTTNRDCIGYYAYVKKMVFDDDVELVFSEYYLSTNYLNCTEVEFGSHVKGIAPMAFKDITPNLQHIYCYSPEPPIHLGILGDDKGKEAGVFANIENKAAVTLHVLNEDDVIQAYKAYEGWNEFTIVGDLKRRAERVGISQPVADATASQTRKVLDADGRVIIIAPDGSRYTLQGVRVK